MFSICMNGILLFFGLVRVRVRVRVSVRVRVRARARVRRANPSPNPNPNANPNASPNANPDLGHGSRVCWDRPSRIVVRQVRRYVRFDRLALAHANDRSLHATDDEPRTDREGQRLAPLHTRRAVAVDLPSRHDCGVAQLAVGLLQESLMRDVHGVALLYAHSSARLHG